MIDPLEAAIKLLIGRAELAGLSGRIANKHKYNESWTTSQAGLVVILDDSEPDWYVPKQDVRLEGNWKRLLDEVRDSHWLMVYGDHLRELGYAASRLGLAWDNVSDLTA